MSSSKQFSTAMREWAELFMTRSMHEWVRYVKASGLSMPQFSTLMRLYHHGGCGISELSAHLDVSAAAASQLVDRLVREGYLARAEDPHDRRAKQVTLSPKGRALIEEGMEVRNRWTDDLTKHLNAEERTAVIAALSRLGNAVRKLNPET